MLFIHFIIFVIIVLGPLLVWGLLVYVVYKTFVATVNLIRIVFLLLR